jgi:hypothetical protein
MFKPRQGKRVKPENLKPKPEILLLILGIPGITRSSYYHTSCQ